MRQSAVCEGRLPGLQRLEQNERWSATTIIVVLCFSSSSFSEVPLLPALRPASLIFLLLHVFACHPLSPVCQPLAARTVFTCAEAGAVVTRVAVWKKKSGEKTFFKKKASLTELVCHLNKKATPAQCKPV